MAENSKIEWCDHTFNPWIGCTKVSPACDNCYAETFVKRTGGPKWGKDEPRRLTSHANWQKPLAWDRKAARLGVRYRVFCASLADVFDVEVPDDWRDRLIALVALTPHLDWLLLTKRPKVARDYFADMEERAFMVEQTEEWEALAELSSGYDDAMTPAQLRKAAHFDAVRGSLCAMARGVQLPNLWLGTTVENQAMADARIPWLMDTPAAVRFVSMEPLLGPVDLTSVRPHGRDEVNALLGFDFDQGVACNGLDWVIAGGESGADARPSQPEWFRVLRDQCGAAGVPFLFKQWGEWMPLPDGHHPIEFCQRITESTLTDGGRMIRVGKVRAGRLLDGQIHDAFPEVRHG